LAIAWSALLDDIGAGRSAAGAEVSRWDSKTVSGSRHTHRDKKVLCDRHSGEPSMDSKDTVPAALIGRTSRAARIATGTGRSMIAEDLAGVGRRLGAYLVSSCGILVWIASALGGNGNLILLAIATHVTILAFAVIVVRTVGVVSNSRMGRVDNNAEQSHVMIT